MEALLASIITGLITFAGVIVTNSKAMAIVQTEVQHIHEEMERLRKEVEKHNNFASRIPVLEEQYKSLDHRLGEIERRLDNER